MPQCMENSQVLIPGMGEEDCLYPIHPQLLPSSSLFLQPYPLTTAHFHAIYEFYQSPITIQPKHGTKIKPKIPSWTLETKTMLHANLKINYKKSRYSFRKYYTQNNAQFQDKIHQHAMQHKYIIFPDIHIHGTTLYAKPTFFTGSIHAFSISCVYVYIF